MNQDPVSEHGKFKKIALYGFFGMGNLGNDGSLQAMLRQVRRLVPAAEISCVSYDPAEVRKDFGIDGVRIDTATARGWGEGATGLFKLFCRVMHRLRLPYELVTWVRAINYLRKYDVVIVAGTGLLDDFGTGPFTVPYRVFKWCLAARLCGTRLLFLSIGAGPIRHPLSRWFMKTAAALGHYRSYRDQMSKDFMTGIGLNTQADLVYPDIVFSLPTDQFLGKSVEKNSKPTIGVGLMAYIGWGDKPELGDEIYRTYVDKISRFIIKLVEEGCEVRLLIGDSHDLEAVGFVRDAISKQAPKLHPGKIICEPISSIDDVLRQIAPTDLVAATRFHNVVCALMMEKPVVSIGYAAKNEVLLTEMDLDGFSQHVEEFDVNKTVKQVMDLVSSRSSIVPRLREKNREYRASLDQQFTRVLLGADH